MFERRPWLLAIVVVLAILLGCGLLLAFNYFLFADVGLELPPTETPSQLVVPLLTLRCHDRFHVSAAQPPRAYSPKRAWKGRVAP